MTAASITSIADLRNFSWQYEKRSWFGSLELYCFVQVDFLQKIALDIQGDPL